MANIKRDTFEQNDWNQPGDLGDFLPAYASWTFDWLNVPKMIKESEQIFEYPKMSPHSG